MNNISVTKCQQILLLQGGTKWENWQEEKRKLLGGQNETMTKVSPTTLNSAVLRFSSLLSQIFQRSKTT